MGVDVPWSLRSSNCIDWFQRLCLICCWGDGVGWAVGVTGSGRCEDRFLEKLCIGKLGGGMVPVPLLVAHIHLTSHPHVLVLRRQEHIAQIYRQHCRLVPFRL